MALSDTAMPFDIWRTAFDHGEAARLRRFEEHVHAGTCRTP
jgi:hypothetical protein